MKLLWVIAVTLLCGCATNSLVRECIHCGYVPEADLCNVYTVPCDKQYDHANCDAACHYADKCVAYCYSDTKENPDGTSVVECCEPKNRRQR